MFFQYHEFFVKSFFSFFGEICSMNKDKDQADAEDEDDDDE